MYVTVDTMSEKPILGLLKSQYLYSYSYVSMSRNLPALRTGVVKSPRRSCTVRFCPASLIG